jgi:hypothetical protein
VYKIANKSFKLGVVKQNGIGFSENNNTSYVMPEIRTGVLNITDDNGIKHTLVLNDTDKKFYSISLTKGANGTGNEVYYKDKVNVSGTEGSELTPKVRFNEVRGEYERFFLRNKSESVYFRPTNATSGFPSGLTMDMSIYKDGEPTTPYVTAEDISVTKNEIHFDRKIDDCHRMQTEITANKAPFIIVGKQSNFIVYDRKDDPDAVKSSEDTWQENLSSPTFWVKRGNNLKNSVDNTALVLSGLEAYTEGPDGESTSALSIATSLSLANSSVSSGTLLIWHKIGYTISDISLTQVTTSGNWILSKYEGTIPANIVLTTGDVFDVRIYSSLFTTTNINYYYLDIINNNGNNVIGLY